MRGPIYFTDAAGVRYRVLDGVMPNGAMVVANPLAAWATYRVFRPVEGQRRPYWVKPEASSTPEPALLEQQLKRAEYLPTVRPHAPAPDPR